MEIQNFSDPQLNFYLLYRLVVILLVGNFQFLQEHQEHLSIGLHLNWHDILFLIRQIEWYQNHPFLKLFR